MAKRRSNIKITSRKAISYIKTFLIIIMAVIEIVICAQSYGKTIPVYGLPITIVCCVLLTALEIINTFVIRNFAAKMIFYGLDSALLLTICVLTGNSFLSTMYCIVLTQCYLSVEKFKDKTILFGVSCFLYGASYIVGWVINNPSATIYNSVLEILTGIIFGYLALAIDYIVVLFLLKFYRTNLELIEALKEADESSKRLSEAYEQLTQTKVYEERNRIAKDIHDTAGHSMTTVIMQTEAAKLLIDDNPEEAKNRIISANIQARNALEQMRESVHLLAGRMQTKPLKDEIEEVIAQTIDGTQIKARCDLENVHPPVETYRFIVNTVKELLANGIRHGNATAFYIELKAADGNINLLVSDNGSGVKGEIKEGFGLKGIRQKAEQLKGSCTYSGEDGEGFETSIVLPVDTEEE